MNITDLITDRMHENLKPRDIDNFEQFRWLIEKIATEYAESKVKKLGLFNVSQRSELLSNFASYLNETYNLNIEIDDQDVETFNKIAL